MFDRMKALMVGAGLLAIVSLTVMSGHGAFAAHAAKPSSNVTPIASEGTPEATDTGYDAFVQRLAANLGVSDPAVVDAAIRTTLTQMVDDELASGAISSKKAAQLKKKISSAAGPGHLIGLGQFLIAKSDATPPGAGQDHGNSANAAKGGNGGADNGNASDQTGNASNGGADNGNASDQTGNASNGGADHGNASGQTGNASNGGADHGNASDQTGNASNGGADNGNAGGGSSHGGNGD